MSMRGLSWFWVLSLLSGETEKVSGLACNFFSSAPLGLTYRRAVRYVGKKLAPCRFLDLFLSFTLTHIIFCYQLFTMNLFRAVTDMDTFDKWLSTVPVRAA